MSQRDTRFRRLSPSGDLFAHFGVAVDPPVAPTPTPALRAATTCGHCGWFVDVGRPACPICGQAKAARRGAGDP